jgi:hypothetical protein
VHRVLGDTAGTTRRNVRLAEEDRPRAAHPGDRRSVVRRHHADPFRDAGRRLHTGCIEDVLRRERNSVQRPECLAPGERFVGVTSLVDGPVAGQHHDRVDDRVDLFDAPEEGIHHLDGRDRALTDEPGDVDRPALPDLIHPTNAAFTG